MAHATLATRTVESTDPSLSEKANSLLTRELRAVIGYDVVDVPTTTADHRSDRHATHSRIVASIISMRVGGLIVGLTIAMAIVIALAAVWEEPWVLGAVFVLMLPATALIAWAVMRLFGEEEHLDPDIAAQLSAEGVGDPDHVFNELIHEFQDAVPAGRR